MTVSFVGVRTSQGQCRDYDVTDSNDAWATAVTVVGNQQMGEAQAGQTITHLYAETTVGCCAARVVSGNGQVKALVLGVSVVARGEPHAGYGRLLQPVTIAQGDRLEVFTVATPT